MVRARRRMAPPRGSAPVRRKAACMHSLSNWTGHVPHLSVAHVQLISQSHVLRLRVRQRGRRSKASGLNPCERCLAQADNIIQPLYKLL